MTSEANYIRLKTLTAKTLVRPIRFELMTSCSGGKRSIQTELRAQHYIV